MLAQKFYQATYNRIHQRRVRQQRFKSWVLMLRIPILALYDEKVGRRALDPSIRSLERAEPFNEGRRALHNENGIKTKAKFNTSSRLYRLS
jgi:hypothetical protein